MQHQEYCDSKFLRVHRKHLLRLKCHGVVLRHVAAAAAPSHIILHAAASRWSCLQAPECFYVEQEAQRRMNIPVFHDDQHGTAIIAGAGLINALELVGGSLQVACLCWL